jgi:hypothetical protein
MSRVREGDYGERCFHSGIVGWCGLCYFRGVNRLTKQEQMVLCVIVGLLLTGLAVKAYRSAHPPAQTAKQATP